MPTQFRSWSAAALRRSIVARYRPLAAFAAAALLLQGCASAPPQPFEGPQAANPDARIPQPANHAVLGSYSRQMPVEPASWVERNRGVAPAPKKDGQ
jgi:hypothetical protein